jgi:hypothetical protein
MLHKPINKDFFLPKSVGTCKQMQLYYIPGFDFLQQHQSALMYGQYVGKSNFSDFSTERPELQVITSYSPSKSILNAIAYQSEHGRFFLSLFALSWIEFSVYLIFICFFVGRFKLFLTNRYARSANGDLLHASKKDSEVGEAVESWDDYTRLAVGVLVSSFGKVFILATFAWNYPDGFVHIISLFSLSSNAVAIRALTDCHFLTAFRF